MVTMQTRDFNYNNAVDRIRCIRFDDVDYDLPQNLTEEQRFAAMYAYIDFESRCCVRAIGGLLSFLDRSRIGILQYETGAAGSSHQERMQYYNNNSGGGGGARESYNGIHCVVKQIQPLDVRNMVHVTTQTIDSLRVFYSEQNFTNKRGLKWKDGLSLFRLFNRTVSYPGHFQLRLWFRHPTRDPNVLRNRQQAVNFLMMTQRQSPNHSTAYLLEQLRRIGSVRAILGRMSKGESPARDWNDFYTTLYHALALRQLCSNEQIYPRDIDIFERFARFAAFDELLFLLKSLNNTTDLHATKKQHQFTVRAGIDTELDNVRRTFDDLTTMLDAEAREELEHLDNRVATCSLLYMPQLGFLLQIPTSNTPLDAEPSLTFVFESKGQRFYKSARTEQLNERYGDLKTIITNRELYFQYKLQQLVVRHAPKLAALIRICGELDCLISMALTAQERGYVRPNFTDSGLLEIINGRHPLQELCTNDFVPNSIQSGGAGDQQQQHYPNIKILTGPNMSGKSVYMKQIGLIVYMAHIGSFVPAEYAVIPYCDRILTQIRTVESSQTPLSAFALDVVQVSKALRTATRHSLVLLDEFGRGTLVRDGEALLAATLNRWARAPPAECPHVIASTHFSAVHGMLATNASASIEFLTFEKHLVKDSSINIKRSSREQQQQQQQTVVDAENDTADSLDVSLVQTHKLRKGRNTYNYAMLVAKHELNNPKLITRARELMVTLENRMPLRPLPMPRIESYAELCAELMNFALKIDLNAVAHGILPDELKSNNSSNEGDDDDLSAFGQQQQRAIDVCCAKITQVVENSDTLSDLTTTSATTTTTTTVMGADDSNIFSVVDDAKHRHQQPEEDQQQESVVIQGEKVIKTWATERFNFKHPLINNLNDVASQPVPMITTTTEEDDNFVRDGCSSALTYGRASAATI